jgi:hypothetical protein
VIVRFATANSRCRPSRVTGQVATCVTGWPVCFSKLPLVGAASTASHRPLPTLGVGVLRVGCASHCRRLIVCRRKAWPDESERLLCENGNFRYRPEAVFHKRLVSDSQFKLEKVPGCYFNIGNDTGECACEEHNPAYDCNEVTLPLGLNTFARIVVTRFGGMLNTGVK